MADHDLAFGEPERAAEYYRKIVSLSETQKREVRKTQLKQVLRKKEADAEIQKLRREMQKNDAAISLEPMTGLLNRSALLRVSSEFIEGAAEKKQKVGAILIDIDFFKECNDTYGRSRGDEVIREVARVCRNEERRTSGLPATAEMSFSGSPGDSPMMKYVTLPAGLPEISDRRIFRM